MGIEQLAAEFHHLKANLRQLEEVSGEEPEWDAIAAPMHDRLADLTNELIRMNAATTRDLACKATVLLDWLDPQRTDLTGLLSASLCRDIVLMFPAEE